MLVPISVMSLEDFPENLIFIPENYRPIFLENFHLHIFVTICYTDNSLFFSEYLDGKYSLDGATDMLILMLLMVLCTGAIQGHSKSFEPNLFKRDK